jgi:hypothetical protein
MQFNLPYHIVLPTIAGCWYWLDMLTVEMEGDFGSFIHYLFIILYMYNMGCAVAYWLRHYATNRQWHGVIGCRGFDSRWCHWNFSLTQTFWLHCGSGVNSASTRNEYQDYFLGGKGSQCVGMTTYHLHVPIVLKSRNLNVLEPSGPVQACNGIALPLPLHTISLICNNSVTTQSLCGFSGETFKGFEVL